MRRIVPVEARITRLVLEAEGRRVVVLDATSLPAGSTARLLAVHALSAIARAVLVEPKGLVQLVGSSLLLQVKLEDAAQLVRRAIERVASTYAPATCGSLRRVPGFSYGRAHLVTRRVNLREYLERLGLARRCRLEGGGCTPGRPVVECIGDALARLVELAGGGSSPPLVPLIGALRLDYSERLRSLLGSAGVSRELMVRLDSLLLASLGYAISRPPVRGARVPLVVVDTASFTPFLTDFAAARLLLAAYSTRHCSPAVWAAISVLEVAANLSAAAGSEVDLLLARRLLVEEGSSRYTLRRVDTVELATMAARLVEAGWSVGYLPVLTVRCTWEVEVAARRLLGVLSDPQASRLEVVAAAESLASLVERTSSSS